MLTLCKKYNLHNKLAFSSIDTRCFKININVLKCFNSIPKIKLHFISSKSENPSGYRHFLNLHRRYIDTRCIISRFIFINLIIPTPNEICKISLNITYKLSSSA